MEGELLIGIDATETPSSPPRWHFVCLVSPAEVTGPLKPPSIDKETPMSLHHF